MLSCDPVHVNAGLSVEVIYLQSIEIELLAAFC